MGKFFILAAVVILAVGSFSLAEEVVSIDNSDNGPSEIARNLIEDNPMEKAHRLFHRAKRSNDPADLQQLLETLIQVAEEVDQEPEEAPAQAPAEAPPEEEEASDPTTGWKIGASEGDQGFGLWLDGQPRMVVGITGEVWSAERRGYLNTTNGPSGPSFGERSPGTAIQSGDWILTDTASGALMMTYKDAKRLAITSDGHVWTKSTGGWVGGAAGVPLHSGDPKDEPTPAATNGPEWVPQRFDLRSGETYSCGRWRFGETGAGEFAFYHGDTLALAVDRFGDVFESAAGLVTEVSSEAEVNPQISSSERLRPSDTDCALAQWGGFTPCSKQCGSGTQSRVRNVLIQPSNNGAACGPTEESRKCNTHGCAVDCVMAAWGAWSSCDKTCGGGKMSRKRDISTYPSSQGKPCDSVKDSRSCNTFSCDAHMCTQIDAAVNFNMEKSDDAFFFAGSKVVRWDLSNHSVCTGPSEFIDQPEWNLLPEPFRTKIDAALNLHSDQSRVHFISGTAVLEWDLDAAKPIGEVGALGKTAPFDLLPAPFDGTQPVGFNATHIDTFVDAAVLRKPRTQEVYLFQGSQYMLYDFDSKQVMDGPADLSSWSELPAPFNQKIDAALNRKSTTNQVFFFSGAEFLRWDIDLKQVMAPEGGPFIAVLHKQFADLGLNTCAGYDLNRIGMNSSFVKQLNKLEPVPVADQTVLVGAKLKPFYGDNDVLEGTIAAQAQGETGRAAGLDEPSGVKVLGLGSSTPYAYVVDTGNNAIRRVELNDCQGSTKCRPGNVTTVAGGSEYAGFMDGSGPSAAFFKPRGISGVRVEVGLAKGDLLYVADTGNSAIRRVFIPEKSDVAQVLTAAGGSAGQCKKCLSTFGAGARGCAGCCQCQVTGFADGVGSMAQFNAPTDVAVLYEPHSRGLGSNEYVYVTDARNQAVRRIIVKPGIEAPGQSGEVSTIAGTQGDETGEGVSGFADGSGAVAKLSCVDEDDVPGCALDAVRQGNGAGSGNDVLYVADTRNNALRRIVVPMQFAGFMGKKETEEIVQTEATEESEESAAAPAARKLLSEAAPPVRFTAEGGSAPKDIKCTIPFKYGGMAYNDCITETDPEMGITEELVAANGWCPTGTAKDPMWGPCEPAGYTPTYCVMSPWSVFGRCSVPCGGGVQHRTRTIEQFGDGGMGCPSLNETRSCAKFECGQVSTVAGGSGEGALAHFGMLEDGFTPDSNFNPQSVAVRVNGKNDDVVYVSGNRKSSATLKRIEIKDGIVQSPEECPEGAHHMAAHGKCVLPVANSGQFPGIVSLAAVSEQLVLATTSQHALTALDLSLMVTCEPWITNALNHWNSDEEGSGALAETNALTVTLVPKAGFTNNWQILGLRKVVSQELKFGTGNLVKNVMCLREQARPDEGITTQQRCCITKSSPRLSRPILCDYLRELGGTQQCGSSITPQQRKLQHEAECPETECVRADSGPGSGPRAQADEELKVAMADYVAEAAVVSQNLQAL
jgi:hypothetical protein